MYKMSTVDIQRGHPSAFKVKLRSFQGCVISYNILGHIMTVCYHNHQIIYLIHILQINILLHADKKVDTFRFFCYFDLEMTLM